MIFFCLRSNDHSVDNSHYIAFRVYSVLPILVIDESVFCCVGISFFLYIIAFLSFAQITRVYKGKDYVETEFIVSALSIKCTVSFLLQISFYHYRFLTSYE